MYSAWAQIVGIGMPRFFFLLLINLTSPVVVETRRGGARSRRLYAYHWYLGTPGASRHGDQRPWPTLSCAHPYETAGIAEYRGKHDGLDRASIRHGCCRRRAADEDCRVAEAPALDLA